MISPQQLRRFFLAISLAVMLSVFDFGFGFTNSWAATSLTQAISQPQTQIATMKQVDTIKNAEGKAQQVFGNMTGNLKNQSDGKDKQFKANTLEGINNSIENPNYKPNSENKEVENTARDATDDLESQVRENFN